METQISENNLEYISGPVSWVGFEYEDKTFHFFGDKHSSKESNCEDKGHKCASVINRIKNTNCYSIDYLLEKIFIHCEKNKEYADLFLEAYYQPKKSSISRIKLEKEGYIKDIYNYFLDQTIKLEEEKSLKMDYVKQHYIDIRFSSEKCISVYDIFETLLSNMLGVLTEENSREMMNLAEEIFIEFKNHKLDFHKSNDLEKSTNKVLELMEEWIEEYEDEEDIFLHLLIAEKRLDELRNFYKTKEGKKYGFYYYEFESLKNKKIQFQNKEIYPILEKFIDDKIKTFITDFREMIFSIPGYQDWRNKSSQEIYQIAKKFIQGLTMTFLLTGVTVVDGFTLAKMMKSLKKGRQIIIAYAGEFHILNYSQFFSDVFGLNPLEQPIIGQEVRCLQNKDFGTIFQSWIN